MKKINYKVLLLLWLALEISSIGYFHIYPDKSGKSYGSFERIRRIQKGLSTGGVEISYEKRDLSILVTSVGALLIGGLGYLLQKQK